ncbi:hypothetical protein JH314_08300 [Xanthomonas campestris]|uniref:hypothetical protein n=1 Tax=Xanthomonas campestris TaxID=339 RepID=UPI0023674BFD|nr:hypothetical protein [Xanthomonas campestris]WDJ03391.1 hypothetical protein JH314_08300 [Xanthomonas campestris]
MTTLARIVPAEPASPDSPCLTAGTRVLIGGEELRGISKIVLYAEPSDVWRAEIHCYVHMNEMAVMVDLMPQPTEERPSQQDRIEQKLDALLDALAEDDQEGEEPARTLDGELAGAERDQSQGLD